MNKKNNHINFVLIYISYFFSFTMVSTASIPGKEIIDFINSPFEEEISVNYLLQNFKKRKINIEKEPVHNLHYPERVDTLYHVYYSKSEFHFYRGKNSEILYKAIIKNPQVELKNNIHIRMKKKNFRKVFPRLEVDEKKIFVNDGGNMVSATFSFNILGRLKTFEVNYELFY